MAERYDAEGSLNEFMRYVQRVRGGEKLSAGDKARFNRLYSRVIKFLSRINDDYAVDILCYRYVMGKSWGEVADALGQLSEDTVRKYCKRSIKRWA